jgi:hypothetical protein
MQLDLPFAVCRLPTVNVVVMRELQAKERPAAEPRNHARNTLSLDAACQHCT